MLDFWEKNAYNKDNKSGNQASHLTRQEENPLPELQSPKGGFFAPSGLPKPCPLSRACARQLPQRGSHWQGGQLSSGRAKHNVSEAVVLRCLGQRQLDKERCPEAAVPVSKARPLASCRASGVQWKVTRPANGSPSGRAGAKRLRGRTRALPRLRRD